MMTSQGGLPSSAALEEKKGKEMTTSQGGSSSSTTPKKMQKMPMSWFVIISWDFVIPLITSPLLLGFYDLVEISETTSPPDASPGIL